MGLKCAFRVCTPASRWSRGIHALRSLHRLTPPALFVRFGNPRILLVILDVGTLVAPVWKKTAGVVGGQELSLDDIENVKLRAPTVRDETWWKGGREGGYMWQDIWGQRIPCRKSSVHVSGRVETRSRVTCCHNCCQRCLPNPGGLWTHDRHLVPPIGSTRS